MIFTYSVSLPTRRAAHQSESNRQRVVEKFRARCEPSAHELFGECARNQNSARWRGRWGCRASVCAANTQSYFGKCQTHLMNKQSAEARTRQTLGSVTEGRKEKLNRSQCEKFLGAAKRHRRQLVSDERLDNKRRQTKQSTKSISLARPLVSRAPLAASVRTEATLGLARTRARPRARCMRSRRARHPRTRDCARSRSTTERTIKG